MTGPPRTDILERIYDAALAPERWDEAMSAFRQSFKGIAAGLFVSAGTPDNRLLSTVFSGIAPAEVRSYAEQIAIKNPWDAIPRSLVGETLTDQTLDRVHRRSDAFVRTEMYQEWCRPQDFRHALGGVLADVDGNLLKFTLFRPPSGGYYSEQDIRAYERLQHHMLKAVEINRRLDAAQTQQHIRESALEQLRFGVVVLDAMGRVQYANAHARRVFAPRDGVYESAARLTASGPRCAGLIEVAITKALKSRTSSTFAVPRAKRMDLSVSVLPGTERRSLFSFDQAHVLVLIADPEDRDLGDSAYLAQRWQLAPMEARFAHHLLQGNSVAETAEAMGLTRTTAQWYAKQLLNKLGVRRQSELLLKLMGDLPTFVKLT